MSADLLRQLLALDLSTEQALAVMDIIENRDGDRKEKARARWHKWNDKRLPNVSKREQTLANVSKPTHASASPAPDLENKQTNKPEKKENKSPRDELAVVLDSEHADAVVEHRNKLRKPLTAYAARQLAGSFASCPDANAAADLMIESGWLKIKPGWIESRSMQRATSPPPHQGDGYNAVLNGIINGKHDEHAGPTIDTSYDRTDRGSSANLVQFDAFSKGYRS